MAPRMLAYKASRRDLVVQWLDSPATCAARPPDRFLELPSLVMEFRSMPSPECV